MANLNFASIGLQSMKGEGGMYTHTHMRARALALATTHDYRLLAGRQVSRQIKSDRQ